MRVCLASNNPHKKGEIAAMLRDFEVISPRDLKLEYSADETGETFLENALIKAHALWDVLHSARAVENGEPLIVLADDSGLCVDALNGRPGVHSARFGMTSEGPALSSSEQNELLLTEMDGHDRRTAHFVCCMVAIIQHDRVVTAQERWDGEIAREQSASTGGFGYDPVFFLPGLGCTAADLSSDQKNELSHRGRAIAVVRAAIERAIALPNA